MAEPGRAPSQRAEPHTATRHHWCGGRRRDRRAQDGLAAVPVGGGRARAGLEIGHSEPQARVWRSRGRPGPTAPRTPAAPQATSSTANSGCTAGVKGARGPSCSVRGRRQGLAAVPVGGGRARAGLEIGHSEPQARVWRSRGRAAAHRHTQRPGPTSSARTLRGIATARHSKRGRHQPTPCASALTHP